MAMNAISGIIIGLHTAITESDQPVKNDGRKRMVLQY